MGNKRFVFKFKIKKGDKVVVIVGVYKDCFKVREVLEVILEKNCVVVD